MKVKIYGITKQMKNGTSKKTGKPYSGYFISYGYKREDVNGAQGESLFYSEAMMQQNGNYIPAPGDLCEMTFGRGGFVEGLKLIGKGDL